MSDLQRKSIVREDKLTQENFRVFELIQKKVSREEDIEAKIHSYFERYRRRLHRGAVK